MGISSIKSMAVPEVWPPPAGWRSVRVAVLLGEEEEGGLVGGPDLESVILRARPFFVGSLQDWSKMKLPKE